MTIASLATILNQARQNNQAIAGLVVLGWEDINAFIAAAEAEKTHRGAGYHAAGSRKAQGC